jgi:hypothetical protein
LCCDYVIIPFSKERKKSCVEIGVGFSWYRNVNDMNQAVDRLVVGLAFIPYIF